MRGVDLKVLERERQKVVDFWNNTNPKKYFWVDMDYLSQIERSKTPEELEINIRSQVYSWIKRFYPERFEEETGIKLNNKELEKGK